MRTALINATTIFLISYAATAAWADSRRVVVADDIRAAGKETNVTSELQAIIDSTSAAGGGVVFLPPGDYLVGSITLKDNTYLELSAGATIYGSTNIDDYKEVGSSGISALICSSGAKNIGILGNGTINGQGDTFWRGKKRPYTRPGRLVLLYQSENVKIRDVTITNSPNWCVDIRECDRVWIDSISIINERKSPNSDGIDPVSSSNVVISNCYIDTGDDAICPKTRGSRPLENLVVTNCVLRSDDSAIKLGTRSDSDIRNVMFSNIVIRDTQYGIALFAKDGGTFKDITFQGIHVETTRAKDPSKLNSRETYPIFVDIEKRTLDSRMSHVQGVTFRDITIDTMEGTCLFLGQPDCKIQDLHLSDFEFKLHHRNPTSDNRKPRGTKSLQDLASNDYSSKAASLVFAHVDNLEIRGFRHVDNSVDTGHERRVLWGRDVHNVLIRELSTRQSVANREMPVFRFEGCSDIELTSCSPGTTAASFVEADATSEKILMHGNNCTKVARMLVTDDGFDEKHALLESNLSP